MLIYIRVAICKIFVFKIALLSAVDAQTKQTRYDAKPTLALFTFKNDSLPVEDLATYAEILKLELHHTKAFIIVEQNQIYELLNEKGYDKIDCITNDCAYEIGRLIGFKKAITGSLEINADTCIVNGELLNIETQSSEIQSVRKYIGEMEKISPYIQIMAWEFASLDPPKDIKSIVEKDNNPEQKKSRWRWIKWAIKPFNYIANRVRDFLPLPSTE